MQESLGEKPVKDTGRWGRRRRSLCWSWDWVVLTKARPDLRGISQQILPIRRVPHWAEQAGLRTPSRSVIGWEQVGEGVALARLWQPEAVRWLFACQQLLSWREIWAVQSHGYHNYAIYKLTYCQALKSTIKMFTHVNTVTGNWGLLETHWNHAKSQDNQHEIVYALETWGLILFYLKVYNHYFILTFIYLCI